MANFAHNARQCIFEYRAGLKETLDALSIGDVEKVIAALEEAYAQGRQVFIIGNGGSAATASHMACDLAKTVLGKSPHPQTRRFRVLALTDNVPLLTAWGNDVSYHTVFAEQLRNLANPGDLLISITGSGNSPNIVEAVRAAKELGLESIGLLGFDGGAVREMVDKAVIIRSDNYGYIEDMHMILTHLITHFFKQAVAASQPVPAYLPALSVG